MQWAVYEAIATWGVTYLVQGDVLPEPGTAGPFRLPVDEVRRRPVFSMRCFRIINDMLNSGILWTQEDHERLFDQLVKLRFNAVYAATYPHQPWCHWSFRGVERSAVDLVYGFRHVVHERTVGKEHFPKLGHFTNPDFLNFETYEERLAAGRRFMHGIIEAAHRRGLRFIFSHTFNDFPEEFKAPLAAWSRRYRIPRSTMSKGGAGKIGLHLDGGGMRYGHLCTPLNPVFVEMVESWLGAHLAEYPQIDGIYLNSAEFPPAAGGVEKCWGDLSQAHGLAPQFTFHKLMRHAGGHQVGTQKGRGRREALGAVATVRLLDLVVNEPKTIEPLLHGKKIYATCMSDALLPVLPHVFDHDQFAFIRTGDYLTSRVAEHMDRMAFARESPFQLHLTTTINDDNVGFLPQFNTGALHTMVKGMRRFGVAGYWFRQFDISEYEPVMGYMIEAGWDRTATPRKTYTRQVERICGDASVAPMIKAFGILERLLEDTDAVIGTGFMMPNLIAKFWVPGFFDAGYRANWKTLMRGYDVAIVALEHGVALSEPRGQQYAGDLLAFVRFARAFVQTATQVNDARGHYDDAEALIEARGSRSGQFDVDGYDAAIVAAAAKLNEAMRTLEKATRLWADAVRDPTDRGSLLGLNAYGIDWLRGKADEVRMMSEHWGLRV